MRQIGTDQDAFEAFYREHLNFVRTYVARRVDDAHTAADLTADIFLAAIESAHRYDEARASPGAWLSGIARNVVADQQRKKARELRAVGRINGRALLDEGSVERIHQRLDAERATRELYQALQSLPATQRAVVELVAIDGLSLTESAAVLGITAANARTRYHRGRTRLRSALPTTLCEVLS